MADHTLLVEPVSRFVDDLAPALVELSQDVAKATPAQLRDDVVNEAFNIAAAFVDVDGLHTDDEINGLLVAFAAHVDTLLPYAAAWQVREAGVLKGKRSFVNLATVLFDIFVKWDAAHQTSYSWWYYERAMAIAHAVCALDAFPAQSELEALERYRTMMLNEMELAGVRNPDSGRKVQTTISPAEAAAAKLPDEPVGPPRPLEELLAELDGLIGLAGVKAEVKLVANLIQVETLRRERGLPVVEHSRHLVFTGNPGTGKTTVARLLAEIYRTLRVVDKGHLVETDRSGLVAGYVGQTAIQVRAVFEKALGGVLLIDEAYALARGGENDFGQEATDTLVKLIEDHRDEIVVIAAGYPAEMHEFIESNPGLRSRFPKTIDFPDYTTDELLAIFESMGKKSEYALNDEARARLREWFDAQPRDKGFGNGRVARNLFEAAVARQASRVVALKDPTNEQLCELQPADVLPEAAG